MIRIRREAVPVSDARREAFQQLFFGRCAWRKRSSTPPTRIEGRCRRAGSGLRTRYTSELGLWSSRRNPDDALGHRPQAPASDCPHPNRLSSFLSRRRCRSPPDNSGPSQRENRDCPSRRRARALGPGGRLGCEWGDWAALRNLAGRRGGA